MVFSPVGQGPPAQAHIGGKSGAPLTSSSERNPLSRQGSVAPPSWGGARTPWPTQPCGARRQRWERGELRPVRGLEAGAGGMGKKGSLEERAKGLLYLYKKRFQSWSPTGITCKALKIPQCPGSTLEQISQNLCGQGLCPQIFSKNSEMLMCRESWKPSTSERLVE